MRVVGQRAFVVHLFPQQLALARTVINFIDRQFYFGGNTIINRLGVQVAGMHMKFYFFSYGRFGEGCIAAFLQAAISTSNIIPKYFSIVLR